MIMAIVKVMAIFHVITVMINTMPCPAGAMIIQDIISMIIPLTTETTADVMMTVITITSTKGTIISVLPINKR